MEELFSSNFLSVDILPTNRLSKGGNNFAFKQSKRGEGGFSNNVLQICGSLLQSKGQVECFTSMYSLLFQSGIQ